MGLPYILGDKDPKDPKTWDKTWAFLKELDQYIDYYPSGTAITFKELAEGTRDIIASHIGWDMQQRILGAIPADFQGGFMDNMTWVADAQFCAIPKGLDNDRLNVTLALIAFLMQPSEQAVTYDSGYFYPGPAIKNVKLEMAPKDSQDKITAAIRPAYDLQIKKRPFTTPLDPMALVEAFDMWDKLVGAKIKSN
jgi:putative spermidine/putrescine transport system substrate-binding protein